MLEYYIPKTTTDRRTDHSFKTILQETELDYLCWRIRKERSVSQEIRTYITMSFATKIDIEPTKAYIIDIIEAKIAPQKAFLPGIYQPTPRLLKPKKTAIREIPIQKVMIRTIIKRKIHNQHQRIMIPLPPQLAPRKSPS